LYQGIRNGLEGLRVRGTPYHQKSRKTIEQKSAQLHGLPIVARAYTIPHPGTVVVETLDTVVALPAMRGAWGSVHLARSAILELQFLAVDLVIFEAVE